MKLNSCFNCVDIKECKHIKKEDLDARRLSIRLCKNYKGV